MFSREHELVRKLARRFAERELTPSRTAAVDETGEYPKDLLEKMAAAGFFGITIPEEYGGAGLDYRSYVLVMEEISRKCASSAVHVTGPNSLVGTPIYKYGTEDQKRRLLVPLVRGEKCGAFALTESGAGSDAGGIRTAAARDGNSWILRGRKTFITHAPISDFFIVFAKTDKTRGVKGISTFLVERGTPGLSTGQPESKMGIRGSKTSDVILDDVRVPSDSLLGVENEGFLMAMKTLDVGRLGVAAQAVGIAQGAMDEVVGYVKRRKQFGKSLAAFQNTQFMLAEMETKLCAARALLYQTAYRKDRGEDTGKDAAMAKFYAAETAMEVATKALQLHGGYGYMKDYPIERMFRDARVTSIYEGTSQVQQMVIASYLLK